jgi:hypothetical protein
MTRTEIRAPTGALHLLDHLFVPSVRALVSPVLRNTSMAGHHVSIVSAR